MKSQKVVSIAMYVVLLALFLWLTLPIAWPTLAMLAVLAWLSLDSLLDISRVGRLYNALQKQSFGAFHLSMAKGQLVMYAAFAVALVFFRGD